ncbi:Hypp4298 [Branchiostoma lanceolatum]|uniref:Hypp4298 protein n=1 Tax=Branchiostoma lanceolatum TaxID=7740 RepID=A0A8K0A998_BRALA|nr:Hypp4298 [Branchiostoma lanceolatum]
MTRTRTALLTGLFVLLAFITVLPPLIQEGEDSFFPTYFVCRFEGPARLVRQFLANTCFIVTLTTMFFCYYKIWREVMRQQAILRRLQPAPLAPLTDGTQGTSATGGQTQDTAADQPGDENGSADLEDVWAYPRHVHVNLGFQLDDADESGTSEEPTIQNDPQRDTVAQRPAQPVPDAQETGRPLLSPEFRQRLRTVGTVMMVVVVFWATWIPYSVTFFRLGFVGVEEVVPTDGVWQRLSILVSMVSTYSNPIIYAYRNIGLRQAFLQLWRR